MESIFVDLRYALRLLAKSPGFSAAAILAVALGIGVNSALFSLVDATILRPLPYGDPDRLAMLWEDTSAFGVPKERPSPANFLDWRDQNRSFEDVAAFRQASMNLTGDGPPDQIHGRAVMANLLPLLGVKPVRGRWFTAVEEAHQSKLVIISHRLWLRRFAADPALVGQSITLDDMRYTVIGIMPAGFHFPASTADFWIPLALSPEQLSWRNSHFLYAVARRKPDVTLERARSDMRSIARRLEQEFPEANAKTGVVVTPLKEEVLGNTRTAVWMLFAAACCVLLIACANVANLLLARAAKRQREIAVRVALGAGAGRLIRQMLTESLVLSLSGGLLGLLFAAWSGGVLQTLIPEGIAASAALRVDPRMLAFTAAVSILTGILFGIAPAFRMTNPDLAAGLKHSAAGNLGGGRAFRRMLVIGEVALAMVLLAGAGLTIRTLFNLRGLDPGFRPEGMLTAQTELPFPKYDERAKRDQFFEGVLARVKGIPGVESAGFTSDLPFLSRGDTQSFAIESRPPAPGQDQSALYRVVSDQYLQTIRARLAKGRFFNEQDREGRLPVMIINETFARRYWPDENPLGKRLRVGREEAPWLTIVGVVRDIRESGLEFAMRPGIYVPLLQTAVSYFLPTDLAVRTSLDPHSLAKPIRQAVWSVDAGQPVSHIRTMEEIFDAEVGDHRQQTQLLGAFAALALVMSALGLYSVLSYAVAGRTREIGLRMAIGATTRDVVRLVLAEGMGLAAIGQVAGLAAALAVTRLMSSLLFGVSAFDPETLLVGAGLLVAVAAAACYLPARRAAHVDPQTALRFE